MNTISAQIPNASRARTAIAIIVALSLTLALAAIAALGAETSDIGGGILPAMGDYVTTMTEALGNG
jgi:hypothetical protein